MNPKQPKALAQECADYATSLRSTINVVKLEGREPPISFLRAAELFERAAARIAALDALRTGYDAARLEIASLRERVQQLGQLARDVNSRRVTELEAQLAAVGAGGVEPLRKRERLHQISEPAQPAAGASRFGSPELQAMIIARCVEKDRADSVPAGGYPPLPNFDSSDEPIWEAIFNWKTATPGADAGRKANKVENAIIETMRAYVDADRAALEATQASPVDANVQQDAERYQFLRDGEWRRTDLESVIRLQLNTMWDAKIDAAIAAQQGGANG